MEWISSIESILNPVRVLKAEDIWQMSRYVVREKVGANLHVSLHQLRLYQTFKNIFTRYETITSLPLSKEIVYGDSALIKGDFEINEGDRTELTTKPFSSLFTFNEDTLHDLIYFLNKKNVRTLFWTENFIKQLIQ